MLRVGVNAISLLSPFTGVGQYTRSLVGELQADPSLETTLFYGSNWSTQVRDAPVAAIDAGKRMFKRIVPRSYDLVRALAQIPFSWGARGKRFDVYHEPNFQGFHFNGPRVVTAHDLSWMLYPHTQPADRVANMNRYFPRSLGTAAHVITDAEFIRRQVMDVFGVAAERVTAIPLGARPVFHARSPADCAATLQRHGLEADAYLLSVGTIEPRKNLRLTVEAYQGLAPALRQRFPLVIVGMRGWLHSPLERLLQPLVQAGEVRMLGYVHDTELAELYASCSAMIYPSIYEGFGLPPLEAMTSGAPVVVSNASTLPEVVGEAGILVDPNDDQGLCSVLRDLLQDPARRGALRKAGLQRASGFSWAQCARQTADVYRRVARTA